MGPSVDEEVSQKGWRREGCGLCKVDGEFLPLMASDDVRPGTALAPFEVPVFLLKSAFSAGLPPQPFLGICLDSVSWFLFLFLVWASGATWWQALVSACCYPMLSSPFFVCYFVVLLGIVVPPTEIRTILDTPLALLLSSEDGCLRLLWSMFGSACSLNIYCVFCCL